MSTVSAWLGLPCRDNFYEFVRPRLFFMQLIVQILPKKRTSAHNRLITARLEVAKFSIKPMNFFIMAFVYFKFHNFCSASCWSFTLFAFSSRSSITSVHSHQRATSIGYISFSPKANWNGLYRLVSFHVGTLCSNPTAIRVDPVFFKDRRNKLLTGSQLFNCGDPPKLTCLCPS